MLIMIVTRIMINQESSASTMRVRRMVMILKIIIIMITVIMTIMVLVIMKIIIITMIKKIVTIMLMTILVIKMVIMKTSLMKMMNQESCPSSLYQHYQLTK